MSLLLITNPPTTLTVSSQWGDFVNRSGKNMLGYGLSIPVFSLTNWDATTTKPEIASGSIIEVGGSFYQADSDTALTDESGISDGTVHIKLVPAGGGASVVPTLTNDAIPTWSAVKAGWYDNDDKFLPYEMEKASAVYTGKGEFVDHDKQVKKTYSGFESITMTGQMIWKKYYKATSVTNGTVFSVLSQWVTAIGKALPCSGVLIRTGTQRGIISKIYREAATRIYVQYQIYDSTVFAQERLDEGASDIFEEIEIMSNYDEFG